METGSELSKTVAIFIVQKILLDDIGLGYICATYGRFYAVGTVLSNMVVGLVELKRPREEGEEIQPGRGKRQRRDSRRKAEESQDAVIKVECTFINTTTETMSDRRPSQSSGHSTPLCSWDGIFMENEAPLGYETPLSSVCDDELIDPALLPAVTVPEFGAIEVVDLAGSDVSEPKCSGAGMIQSAYDTSGHIYRI